MIVMARIESLPVVLDPVETSRRLRFDPDRAGFASLEDLLRPARDLMAPRALWDVVFIGARGERTVEIGPAVFESPLLARTLDGANKVFPFIITIGPELERTAAGLGDLLKQYYLEEIANLALEQAADRLARLLETRFGVAGLSGLSPGSLVDWPITEQPKLFSLFGDAERLIGVRLTDSLLMVPRKSISGILFPSEEGFVACALCDRENCQGRKAPYDPGRPKG